MWQNLSKIDAGGDLEATWESALKHDASKISFWTILGTFWDPHLGPVWAHFGHKFLMFFWSAFLKALASIWAPKTPPKWDPKGVKTKS